MYGASGNYVMWIGNGSGGHGVYLYNLQTFETTLMNNSGTEYVGDINGNWITWSQANSETGNSETYVMNCSGGNKNKTYESEDKETKECANKMKDKGELQRVILSERITLGVNKLICWDSSLNYWYLISDTSSGITGVTLKDDLVFWSDNRNGNYDIFGYNLNTREEFDVAIAPGDQFLTSCHQQNINKGDDFITWIDGRNTTPENPFNYDIYGYNILTHEEFIIANTGAEEAEPVAFGNKVAWVEKVEILDGEGKRIGWNDKIKIKDLQSGIVQTLIEDQTYKTSLRMNNDYLVWNSTTDPYMRLDSYDIHGYSFFLSISFPVCTQYNAQFVIEVLQNKVIWEDERNGESDICGATLEIVE